MNKQISLFLLIFSFILVFLSPVLRATENRIALVIGNANYQRIPLENPVNDAKLIADTLKKMHFEVILKLDVTQIEMDDAINQLGKKLEAGGVGLFFYAGHGIQSNGNNYLIPVKANLSREKDLKYKAINANSILDEMGNANNGLNIVILDACRDNPLSRSFRSATRGLTRIIDVPTGTLLAYSTTQGKVSVDGEGDNSPYTLALVKAMKQPGSPLELVFKEVLKQVKKSTNGEQVPWFTTSVEGDFYFTQASHNNGSSISQKVIASSNNSINSPSYTKVLRPQLPAPEIIVASQPLLTIRSNVYGDSVKINGVYMGSTRLDLKLSAGNYHIEIMKQGYTKFEKHIHLEKAEKITLYAQLKKQHTHHSNFVNNSFYTEEPFDQEPDEIEAQGRNHHLMINQREVIGHQPHYYNPNSLSHESRLPHHYKQANSKHSQHNYSPEHSNYEQQHPHYRSGTLQFVEHLNHH